MALHSPKHSRGSSSISGNYIRRFRTHSRQTPHNDGTRADLQHCHCASDSGRTLTYSTSNGCPIAELVLTFVIRRRDECGERFFTDIAAGHTRKRLCKQHSPHRRSVVVRQATTCVKAAIVCCDYQSVFRQRRVEIGNCFRVQRSAQVPRVRDRPCGYKYKQQR